MATEQEFWGRPLEPGPVKVEPTIDARRARMVRDALDAAGLAAFGDGDTAAAQGFMNLARCAGDRALAHLGRLLK